MLSPAEFVETYAGIGEKKAAMSLKKLVLLSILAGFAIGIGGAATASASYAIANPSAARLLCGLLFPLGLIMVVFTGAELFTGNCLMTISLLERRIGAAGFVRNLAVVYLGNLAGSLLLAAAMFAGNGDALPDGLALKLISTAAGKCALPFGRALVLGILCNILVCVAVMMALCGKSGADRAAGAFIPICAFVVCGFEHCVANMYFIPVGLLTLDVPRYAALAADAGVQTAALTWGGFFLRNLLPVTLGNVIGGCGFAALLWSAHRKSA